MKILKKSLLLISFLLIFIISLGFVSASEEMGLDICYEDSNIFESEDISNSLDSSDSNDYELDSSDSDVIGSGDSDSLIIKDDSKNSKKLGIDQDSSDEQGSSKLGINIIPVKHTGDDAKDIQTAITAASNRDIVYLGDYHYNVGYAQINVTKNITLQGNKGTTFIQGYGYTEGDVGNASSGSVLWVSASGATVEGIIFENIDPNLQYTDWDTLYGWALKVSSVTSRVNIYNCSFINFNHGVHTGGTLTTIKDCYFTGIATRIMTYWDSGKERGTKAIHLDETTDVLIENNIFDGPMLDSILIDYGCINTRIINNQFINNSYSIYIYGYGESETHGTLIANNTFANCGHFEGDYYGQLKVFNYLPIIEAKDTYLHDIAIVDNTFNLRDKTFVLRPSYDYTQYLWGGVNITNNNFNKLNDTVNASTICLFYVESGLIKDLTSLRNPIHIVDNEYIDGMYVAYFEDYINEIYEPWISYFGDLIIPVNGIDTSINIILNDASAGESSTIDFLFTDNYYNSLNGNIKVLVDNEVYNVSISDGEGHLTIDNISQGIHHVYAAFGGNDTHYNALGYANFSAIAKDSHLSLNVSNITSGQIVNVLVNLVDDNNVGLSGVVSVILNGKTYDVNVTNGEGTLRVAKITDEGVYRVTATFAGDSIYNASNASANFTVYPRMSNLDISAEDIVSGNPLVVNVTLADLDNNPLNGEVYIKANGRTYQVTVNRGKGSIRLDGLVERGIYPIVAEYYGSQSQVNSSCAIDVEVMGRNTVSTVNVIGRGEGSYDVNLDLSSNNKAVSAVVSLIINGEIYDNVYLQNGHASISLNDVFARGNNTVEIKFYGDSIYLPSNGSVIVEVIPSNIVFVENTGDDLRDLQNAIDIAKAGDIIDLENRDFKNIRNLNITKDLSFISDGASISSNSDDGNDLNPIFIISEGVSSLNVSGILFKLNSNDSVVFINTTNNSNTALYLSNNEIVKASDDVAADTVSIISVLSNSQKLDFKNEINVGANDCFDGISLVSIVNANFAPERMATEIIYSDMNTTAIDSSIEPGSGEFFNVTLRDSDDNALVDKTVLFGFNGKIYNKTTNSNGVAQLQINLQRSDIYTFAVCFLGDDDYNGSFAVAKITVKKQSPSLTVPAKSYLASAKSKSLTATFKSASGKVVPNKKVTFTVNGKTYTATTNSKGVATVNVSLSKKGTYSFTVKYAGDNTYAAISKSAKLTIK